MGDERHFRVIFGYETAALSSRGEDDLIKVLNATSPLDLSPTLAFLPRPQVSHRVNTRGVAMLTFITF